jgi:hypothetical protein
MIRQKFGIDFPKFCVKSIWVLLLSSCLTPIDVETENLGGKLVVSGQVSTIPDQNFVQLGLTADTDRLPVPLSGATVTLLDDTGQSYKYTEDFSNPGMYFLTDVAGIPLRTYWLQVIKPSGETYRSEPEKIPADAGQLTTTYEFVREEFTDPEGIVSDKPFIKIYLNSTLPSGSEIPYVKWSTIESFLLSPTDFPDPFGSVPRPCFVVQNADPQRIVLFNGEDVKTTTVENLLGVSRIVDWTFFEKHYFTTYQSSLTKEAYAYWRKVDILANQVGSIFDTPPAEIKGNIYNINSLDEKVYGYFQATNENFDRFYLFQDDLGFPLLLPNCIYDSRNFQDYPARCLDCHSVRNSTGKRPEWF